MENTIRTITLHAQEITKGNQRFIACSSEINEKWYKIKFTKACGKVPPTEKGLYELTIDCDDCSVENGKNYTNSKGKTAKANDTIWVRRIVNLRKYTPDELKAENRQVMNAVFGNIN